MTTFAEILAFVKGIGRIPDTTQDTNLGLLINESNRRFYRKLQSRGSPAARSTATFAVVAGTQDYDLAEDFDVLIDNSVRYYTSGEEDYRILDIVSGPDAELWESMQETSAPMACRVIAGSAGTSRKLRIMPLSQQSGKSISYAYWTRPATLTVGSTLGIPELSDAIAYDVLASTPDIFRDANSSSQQQVWLARSKASFNEVLGTLNP